MNRWILSGLVLASFGAGLIFAPSSAFATRPRVSGAGTSVKGPATGAGTDTCTGDGCNIGPVGIATDGGVNLCTGAGGTACTLLTGGTSGMIVNTGYVWIPSNAGIYLNLGGTRRIFDNGTNTAVNGPFSIVGGLDGVTALTNSGAAGNIPITGSVSVASGKALYFNGATATIGIDYNATNVEVFGAGLAVTTGQITNSALTGTAASGTGITAVATSTIRNWVHKVTVANTALVAAGTSDVTLHVTPVNTRIVRVVADVTQVFTGGALSAMTVMCGNSAGGNQYLLANSVFTAQNTWGDVVAEMGAGVVSATLADFGTVAAGVPGAITVQCRFTCTGANCSAATQGSVTFYVEGVTYP